MSSKSFENLTSKIPKEEGASLHRLEEYICALKSSNQDIVLTINRLYDILSPSSHSALVLILQSLMNAGVLKQVIRVVSPKTGAGIGEFSSLTEIPNVIHDLTVDEDIEVHENDIKILYKMPSDIKKRIECEP